jgi:hypothetical protein
MATLNAIDMWYRKSDTSSDESEVETDDWDALSVADRDISADEVTSSGPNDLLSHPRDRVLNALEMGEWEGEYDLKNFSVEDFGPYEDGRTIFHTLLEMNIPIGKLDQQVLAIIEQLELIRFSDMCGDSNYGEMRDVSKLVNLPDPKFVVHDSGSSAHATDESISEQSSWLLEQMVQRATRLFGRLIGIGCDIPKHWMDPPTLHAVGSSNAVLSTQAEDFNYSEAWTDRNPLTYLLTKYRFCKDEEMIDRVKQCFEDLFDHGVSIDIHVPRSSDSPTSNLGDTKSHFTLLDFLYCNGWGAVFDKRFIDFIKAEMRSMGISTHTSGTRLVESCPTTLSWWNLLEFIDEKFDLHELLSDPAAAREIAHYHKLQDLIDTAWRMRMVKSDGAISYGKIILRRMYKLMMKDADLSLQYKSWYILLNANSLFEWLFDIADFPSPKVAASKSA